MKRVSFLLSLTLAPFFCTVDAQAQWRAGVVAGVNASFIDVENSVPGEREGQRGLHLGLVVERDLLPWLSLRAEPSYTSAGGRFAFGDAVFNGTKSRYALDYLALPVLSRARVSRGPVSPIASVGVSPAWLIRERTRVTDNSGRDDLYDSDQNYRSFNVGLLVEGGVDLRLPTGRPVMVGLTVRHERGLTSIQEVGVGSTSIRATSILAALTVAI